MRANKECGSKSKLTTELLVAAVVSLFSGASFAATINVPADQPTIQAGIDAAQDSDTVLVAPGTYYEHLDMGSTSIVLLSSAGAGGTHITSDGSELPLMTFPANSMNGSVVSGFTLRGGTEGGILIPSGTHPKIISCVLLGNTGDYGAGILCAGQNVTIQNTRFVQNSGREGGGLALINAQNVTIDSCEFYDNIGSRSGGAIYARGVTELLISRCVVWHNSAEEGEGGGFTYIYLSSDVHIINCTIVSNIAPGRGAGITLWRVSGAEVRNNIVAFNEGDSHGVFVGDDCSGLELEYNDVFGNGLGDYEGVDPGNGSISADPLFANAAEGDFSLLVNSPCINAGDPDPQYNDPGGTRNDMGAIFECPPESPDTDGDGNIDCLDICPGFDDFADSDGDTAPDGCDVCPGYDDYADADTDGVSDGCDICPGYDDFADMDSDGLADGCDNCRESSNLDQTDTDGDGSGDVCDLCEGFDDLLDADSDGIPDGCDVCPGFNDLADADSDGLADGCDPCTDTDSDGFGDPEYAANQCSADNCPDVSNPDQADEDGDGQGDACETCCEGTVGNCNDDPDDLVTIADIATLVDHLFITKQPLACIEECDVNQTAGWMSGAPWSDPTIGDIALLTDYLFITTPEIYGPLLDCPQ